MVEPLRSIIRFTLLKLPPSVISTIEPSAGAGGNVITKEPANVLAMNWSVVTAVTFEVTYVHSGAPYGPCGPCGPRGPVGPEGPIAG